MSLAQPVVGAALSVLSSGSGSGSSSPQGQMAAPAGYTASQMTLDDTFSGTSVNSSDWNTEVGPGIQLEQRGLRPAAIHRRQDQRSGVLLIRSGQRQQRPHPVGPPDQLVRRRLSGVQLGLGRRRRPSTRCPPPGGTSRSAPRCPTAPTACGPRCGSCRRARPRSSTASRVAGRARTPTSRATPTCSLARANSRTCGPPAAPTSPPATTPTASSTSRANRSRPTSTASRCTRQQQQHLLGGLLPAHRAPGRLVVHLGLAHGLSVSTPSPSNMNISEVQVYS